MHLFTNILTKFTLLNPNVTVFTLKHVSDSGQMFSDGYLLASPYIPSLVPAIPPPHVTKTKLACIIMLVIQVNIFKTIFK